MGIVQESWKLDAVNFNYKYPLTFPRKSTFLLIINTTIFTFTPQHSSLFHTFTFSFQLLKNTFTTIKMKFFTAAALFIAAAMAAPTNVGTRNENAEDCNCTNPEQPSESHDGKPSLNVYKDAKGIFHWGTGPVAAQNYECQPHQQAGVAVSISIIQQTLRVYSSNIFFRTFSSALSTSLPLSPQLSSLWSLSSLRFSLATKLVAAHSCIQYALHVDDAVS